MINKFWSDLKCSPHPSSDTQYIHEPDRFTITQIRLNVGRKNPPRKQYQHDLLAVQFGCIDFQTRDTPVPFICRS